MAITFENGVRQEPAFTEYVLGLERRAMRMREVLEWLDRRGGLGHDAHARIRDALSLDGQLGETK